MCLRTMLPRRHPDGVPLDVDVAGLFCMRLSSRWLLCCCSRWWWSCPVGNSDDRGLGLATLGFIDSIGIKSTSVVYRVYNGI
jgi:hypothetical protein